MQVYAYTFKNELTSLCWNYLGDVKNELDKFYTLGLDGFFADYPNTLRSFLDGQDCSRSMDVDSGATGGGYRHLLATYFQSHWIMLVFAVPLLIGLLV